MLSCHLVIYLTYIPKSVYKMKILHFNTFDTGGAAQGSWRIHQALSAAGVNSFYSSLYISDNNKNLNKIGVPQARCIKIKYRLLQLCFKHLYKNNHKYFTYNIIKNNPLELIKKIKPDIIHFHWIAQNIISFYAMRQIVSLTIPVVWTIRDAWPMTGGCHLFIDCQQWKTGCKDCQEFRLPFQVLARYQWKEKEKSYPKLNPHIVVLSKQFENIIKNSPLLNRYKHTLIPNGIDTGIFRPIDKRAARDILNLPQDAKFILFGAVNTDDYYKGYDLLQAALKKIYTPNTRCLVFGYSTAKKGNNHLQTHYLGYIHDQISLAIIYSAADVFVCPSRAESFSNTTLEALACGVPVVAFPVGAIPEMVVHKSNGILATPYSADELAQGINYILEDDIRQQEMSISARKTVINSYSFTVIAGKYKELYDSLI